jgi:hypothetical protein
VGDGRASFALGDQLAPHFIETVTRRGYRFIAPVTVARSSSVEPTREEEASAPAPAAHSRLRVGRDGPLEILDGVLQQVLIGKRQIGLVTGGAGIRTQTFVRMAMERMG